MHREGIRFKGIFRSFPFIDFSCVLSTLQLEIATTVFKKSIVSHCLNHFFRAVLASPILFCFKEGFVRVGFIFFVESRWQRNSLEHCF